MSEYLRKDWKKIWTAEQKNEDLEIYPMDYNEISTFISMKK